MICNPNISLKDYLIFHLTIPETAADKDYYYESLNSIYETLSMHEFFNECLVKGLPRSTLSFFLIYMPWSQCSLAYETRINEIKKNFCLTSLHKSRQVLGY